MGWRTREKRRANRLVFTESAITDETVEQSKNLPEKAPALFEDDQDAVFATVDPANSTDLSEFDS
jgi:hypothetical protein